MNLRLRMPAATIGTAALLAASTALAGPADELLERVPPDASLALVVEDLDEHARQLLESPLAEGLKRSRLVREWFESGDGEQLRTALEDIEAVLGVGLPTVRDGLFGRAVVLSLHLPDDAAPDEARGLLQTRVLDRDLLQRFIGAVNSGDRASGVLRGVERRRRGAVAYWLRDLDGRPDEAYALLDDGMFVWTNAEPLLLGVLDRHADPDLPALADEPAIDRLDRALPERSIARLYVAPEFLGRVLASDPETPEPDEIPGPIASILGAIDAVGLALEWRDGPVLHVVETLRPDRLPGPVRAWAARPIGDPPLDSVPPSSLAIASVHVDFVALDDLIAASIPDDERTQYEHLRVALRGLLLGREPREAVLPALGPGVVAWVGPPPPDGPIRASTAVAVVPVDAPEAAEAIANALRTAMAFVCLDDDGAEGLRLSTAEHSGVVVTSLAVDGEPGSDRFAFAVGRGRIAVGTDAIAVAEALAAPGGEGPEARSPMLEVRGRHFPDASTFAYLDLDALVRLAGPRRDELARSLARRRGAGSEDSAREDLDRLLELGSLFRGLYVTSGLAADASIAHQRLGLIAADEPRE